MDIQYEDEDEEEGEGEEEEQMQQRSELSKDLSVTENKKNAADKKFPLFLDRHSTIVSIEDVNAVKKKIAEAERTLLALHDLLGSRVGILTYDAEGAILDSVASLNASGHYFVAVSDATKSEIQKCMTQNLLVTATAELGQSPEPIDPLLSMPLPVLRQIVRDLKSRNGNKYPSGFTLRKNESVSHLTRERCREFFNCHVKMGRKTYRGLDAVLDRDAVLTDWFDYEILPSKVKHLVRGTIDGRCSEVSKERSRNLGLKYKRQKAVAAPLESTES